MKSMALLSISYTLLILAGIQTVVIGSEDVTGNVSSASSTTAPENNSVGLQTEISTVMSSTTSEIYSSQNNTENNTSEMNTTSIPTYSSSSSNDTTSIPTSSSSSSDENDTTSIPTSSPHGSKNSNRMNNLGNTVQKSTSPSPASEQSSVQPTSASSKTTRSLSAVTNSYDMKYITIFGIILLILLIIGAFCYYKRRHTYSFDLYDLKQGDGGIPLECPESRGAFEPIGDQIEKNNDVEQMIVNNAANDKASVTNPYLMEENVEKQNNCETEKNHNSASPPKENGDNLIDWNLQDNLLFKPFQDSNFSDIDFSSCDSV